LSFVAHLIRTSSRPTPSSSLPSDSWPKSCSTFPIRAADSFVPTARIPHAPAARLARQARLRAGRVVPSAPPGSPRSPGVEARPSETTLRPCRSPRGASPRTVRLGQAEPRRLPRYSVELDTADQEGLRRGPPRRQQAPACESPLRCPRCHSPTKIIAVIIDPAQVPKILMHLLKSQRPPPA
jgi:hypothetical protein